MSIRQNAGRVTLSLFVNGESLSGVDPYCETSPNAGDYNSFSIYLNQGDTFYFFSSSPKASTWRAVIRYLLSYVLRKKLSL